MRHLLRVMMMGCAVALPAALWAPPGQAQSGGYFNVPLPTLGGRQLWTDQQVLGGWRLQAHAWTGHTRLLDPDNVRRCWGPHVACTAVMDGLVPPPGVRPLVVLVHGLGRSRASLEAMVPALNEAGFDVESFEYASTRGTLDEHAAALAGVLAAMGSGQAGTGAAVRPVSFVTHSLGSLVVRVTLGDPQAGWRRVLAPQRAVFLAPPSQGSALAETLWQVPPLRRLFGDGGAATLPDAVQGLPVPEVPFAIIAAGQGTEDGINPWLAGDEDGVVKVTETFLDGAAAWSRVEAIHTFIGRSPDAIDQTVAFLSAVEQSRD